MEPDGGGRSVTVDLIARASSSSAESRSLDMLTVTENLHSPNTADRLYAAKQISIWLIQKSQQAQDFVDLGHMRLIVDCLRAPDNDTPSSSNTPDTALPCTSLLFEFSKEGKKCQDAIASCGGVPVLLELLPLQGLPSGDTEVAQEAMAALCLIAVGSEEGRRQIMQAGGLAAIVRCLKDGYTMGIRREAAGAVIGLALERKDRQAAILEEKGLQPLIDLLKVEPDPEDPEPQLAALNAATALRRLCDATAATAEFCHAGGLEAVVSRIVDDEPADRIPLRLPMPLAPSTIRAECKQLLGDVYVSSTAVYQEKIVQVLEKHNITIDRITTTPTASEQTLEGKDSMERGHKVLSCRTSIAAPKVPEIKLSLKRAMKPKPTKAALAVHQTGTLPHVPASQQQEQLIRQRQKSFVRRLITACVCIAPTN